MIKATLRAAWPLLLSTLTVVEFAAVMEERKAGVPAGCTPPATAVSLLRTRRACSLRPTRVPPLMAVVPPRPILAKR